MIHKQSDWILIAHSDSSFAKKLRKKLKKQGMKVSKEITNAFDALGYILVHHPKIAILEHDFSYLSAYDIIMAIEHKHISTCVIHIIPEDHNAPLPNGPFFYKNESMNAIQKCIFNVTSEIHKKNNNILHKH